MKKINFEENEINRLIDDKYDDLFIYNESLDIKENLLFEINEIRRLINKYKSRNLIKIIKFLKEIENNLINKYDDLERLEKINK